MKFTLGIEEEYQVIDPETRELASHEQKIVEAAAETLGEQVKAEMHQAVVEVGTNICTDIHDAREQITGLRRDVDSIARSLGFRIGAAGTHPFSAWQKQLLTPHPRYNEIIHELQDTARSNLIFGLHVHVGIDDRNMALHIANSMRYFLPHVYALSTNSPFWEGRNTGFKAFRSKVFDKFPRTGIPDHFESVAEYDSYVNLLIKTRSIDNAKKIWWDLRVHPFYPTMEIRICDIPLTADETVAITAIIQALVAKLYKLRTQNLNFMSYKRIVLNENKWRASRYGLDGKLIDFGKEEEVDTRALIHEILDFVDDVADDLGSRDELQKVVQILENGTGADRQLKVYEETGSLEKVVDFIIEETMRGINK
ncbi:carboxylate-amine ligase [Fulvivirga sedimenti]|uniref:Putative glutamate--cysteine ligase 2 n=1 Tax=Fulvivirga sedimenti TaxID=2879465 RepID=A0A9X1HQW6_9BACT|nr:carboxylate-amine ligase [Fulvivirga sedimenti]MCA6075134.1 carboxylate-amine ligase [Fulvivirga sedimenti]MCA6076311.1 carboxylate-amine ligase [Fulvivirga sedimenti]MCA6077439.1 carboxylate-amine ligase [Fulvivirga sedimenti]